MAHSSCSWASARTLVSVLFFDGSGLCQFYKRLDHGVFALPDPDPGETQVVLAEWQLDALLDGIDVAPRPKRPKKNPLH